MAQSKLYQFSGCSWNIRFFRVGRFPYHNSRFSRVPIITRKFAGAEFVLSPEAIVKNSVLLSEMEADSIDSTDRYDRPAHGRAICGKDVWKATDGIHDGSNSEH